MPSWKRVIVSGSDAVLNSLEVTNGITGSLHGTASWARNSITSSFVTGSNVFGPFGSNSVISASYAIFAETASYASNGGVTQILAGPNIIVSPLSGKGQVTISSTGTGSGNFNTSTGSYGSFYDTTTQLNPVANAANSMSFNETAITNGVSLSGSTSPFNTYIKTETAGVYNIQFSAQIDKTDGGEDNIDIWIRKNGTDLIDTATSLTLPKNNNRLVAAWNWFVQSATNDYYQIIWSSADIDMRLLAEASSSLHPGIPSVILTANRIDQFLSNTGSFNGTFNGQFTGSLQGTASFANNATSASFATTASYVLNALSASFATSASIAQTASTASFVTASNVYGPFGSNSIVSASFATNAITASYALFAANGGGGGGGGSTVTHTQLTASTTWSFTHNLNTQTPLLQVYNLGYEQIIPNEIVSINAFTSEIRFDYSQSGYAVASTGGSLAITGSTPRLVQTVAATTWSFAHNLGTQFPGFEVFDQNDYVVIPAGIYAVDENNAEIYFALPSTGVAIANFSGIDGVIPAATSASYAANSDLLDGRDSSVFATTGSNQFSGSQTITGSLIVTGQITAQTLNVQQVTSSIVYSSGSNVFGSSLSNTQQLTGSVSVTGSFTVTTTGTELQVTSTGVNLGNVATDIHNVTGSLRVSGSAAIVGNTAVTGSTNITGSLTVTTTGTELQVTSTGVNLGNIATDVHNVTGSLRVSGSATVVGNTAITGSTNITGSFVVTTTGTELQVTSTGVNLGNIVTDVHNVTGSLLVSGSMDLRGNARVSGSSIFSGSVLITGTPNTSTSSSLVVYGSGSSQPVFTVQGSQGELFSITDSLSGSLFSVNDISGLPILEVFSNGDTLMGDYTAPAVYTTRRVASTTAGVNVIYSLATSSYDGVFVDYTIRSGSVGRAGNFMAMWSGSSADFTDNSINGFGITTNFVFGASISGSNLIVSGSGSTAGWTVKTIIRGI
jgi:hypothetical protein